MEETYQQQIVVIGALAYDQISTTSLSFTATANPLLNCKLNDLEEAFGGCGGNIAYNLAGLGHTNTQLVSCTGAIDDARYFEHLDSLGIDTKHCLRQTNSHTARAVIITDVEGHQFTGFFPGYVPTEKEWLQQLTQVDLATSIFIQAPYPPNLMETALCYAASLPDTPLKIWCPGQYADQLTASQAQNLVSACDWLVGNAYELEHIRSHANTEQRLVIETNGKHPVCISAPNQPAIEFSVQAVSHAADPTGCGDAFIAGLAHHISPKPNHQRMAGLTEAVAHGSRLAARCLGHAGSQKHTFSGD